MCGIKSVRCGAQLVHAQQEKQQRDVGQLVEMSDAVVRAVGSDCVRDQVIAADAEELESPREYGGNGRR